MLIGRKSVPIVNCSAFSINAALEDEIQAVNDKLVSLYNSGDADGMGKLYTTDCLFMAPDTWLSTGQFGKILHVLLAMLIR